MPLWGSCGKLIGFLVYLKKYYILMVSSLYRLKRRGAKLNKWASTGAGAAE